MNGAAARTFTTNYAVGGNPLVTSVTDATGTITTTTDLLGRTVAYVDATGVTTTTAYDQAGRDTTDTTTSGGSTSTVTTSYDDASRVTGVKLDGNMIATPAYAAPGGELSSVTYPTGTGNAGNGWSLSTITRDPQGRETGDTFTGPGATPPTIGDTDTMSQAGRVVTDTQTITGTTTAAWTYGYDSAARLTSASLAAISGGRPAVADSYGYTGAGGCGADTAAGSDSARVTGTVIVGGGTPAVTTSCTDYASRLTSATGANPVTSISYNGHGDATGLVQPAGTETYTYDSADRVTSMVTAAGTQRVTYTLDAANRMTTRVGVGTGTGADNTTTAYGYTRPGDTADFELGTGSTLAERYLALPGGALLTRRYSTTGGDVWSIPNLHGDVTATTGPTGTLTGSGYLYDPFGQPLNSTTGVTAPTAGPATATNGPTDAWEGSHQRGYENANGLNATLMGARLYLPTWGQFGATDPVNGGNANAYTYPTDPINRADLNGLKAGPACYGETGATRTRCRNARNKGVRSPDFMQLKFGYGFLSVSFTRTRGGKWYAGVGLAPGLGPSIQEYSGNLNGRDHSERKIESVINSSSVGWNFSGCWFICAGGGMSGNDSGSANEVGGGVGSPGGGGSFGYSWNHRIS